MVKHRVFLFLGLARNYKSVVFPGLVLNLVYLTGGTNFTYPNWYKSWCYGLFT